MATSVPTVPTASTTATTSPARRRTGPRSTARTATRLSSAPATATDEVTVWAWCRQDNSPASSSRAQRSSMEGAQSIEVYPPSTAVATPNTSSPHQAGRGTSRTTRASSNPATVAHSPVVTSPSWKTRWYGWSRAASSLR
nr:hypothetical protein [Micromonospora sp. RL09-050-HVF-A]